MTGTTLAYERGVLSGGCYKSIIRATQLPFISTNRILIYTNMSPCQWSFEMVCALDEYLKANKGQFDSKDSRRDIGYPESAKFISQRFNQVPPLSAQQVQKKFSNLWTKHHKEGYTREQLFKEGMSCLDLSSMNDAGPSYTESLDPKDGTPSETASHEARKLETDLSLLQRDRCRTKAEMPLKCDGCIAANTTIERLKDLLASTSGTATGSSEGSSQLDLLGPSDKNIRLAMEDMSKIIRAIVRFYQKAGFGEIPPDMRIIEKKFPVLRSLAEQVFQVKPQDSLFETTGNLGTKPPKCEELLKSLIGAATHNWALESDFPEFFKDKDNVLRQYQRLIREKCKFSAC